MDPLWSMIITNRWSQEDPVLTLQTILGQGMRKVPLSQQHLCNHIDPIEWIFPSEQAWWAYLTGLTPYMNGEVLNFLPKMGSIFWFN